MSPPDTPRRRPYVRCWRPAEGQPVLPPGTVVDDGAGNVDAFVGDTFAATEAEVDALAARLLGKRQVILRGAVWEACKPWKRALRAAWHRSGRDELRAAKGLGAIRPGERFCGQPRRNGEPCRLAAGWGTATVGRGPCWHHGGVDPARDEALKQLPKQVADLARLTAKAALTPQERLDALNALRAIVLRPKPRRGDP